MKQNPAFTKNAQIFNEAFSKRRNIERKCSALSELFKEYEIKTVLDIGCGGGDITFLLSNFGFDVTGIDNSTEMIAIAKEAFGNEKVKWLCQDFFEYRPFKRFDIGIALYSFFQTLPSEVFQDNFLKQLGSVIKKNGYAILELQNQEVVRKEYPFNVINRWTHKDFIIEAKSYPIDSECYNLNFCIRDSKTLNPITNLDHIIRYVSRDILVDKLKSYNISVLKWLDSEDFKSDFNIKRSLGFVCLIKIN
jgi:SAM-dependent methyltransferase